jgi:hypothetical protein
VGERTKGINKMENKTREKSREMMISRLQFQSRA